MNYCFHFCLLILVCNSMQLQQRADHRINVRHLQATAAPFPSSNDPVSASGVRVQFSPDDFEESYDNIRTEMVKMQVELRSLVRGYFNTPISQRTTQVQNFANNISEAQAKLKDLAASLQTSMMRLSNKLMLRARSINLQKTYDMLSSDVNILLAGGDPMTTRIYSGVAYGIGLADNTPIQTQMGNPFEQSIALQSNSARPVSPFPVSPTPLPVSPFPLLPVSPTPLPVSPFPLLPVSPFPLSQTGVSGSPFVPTVILAQNNEVEGSASVYDRSGQEETMPLASSQESS